MPDPTTLLGAHRVAPGQRQVVLGVVAYPAPASASDPLYVLLEALDAVFVAKSWPEGIHGATLPEIGSDCLCVWDDAAGGTRERSLWCLAWEGDHS